MPNLVRRTSSNDTLRWIAEIFVLICLIIVTGAFVQRVCKAMRRTRAHSSSPPPLPTDIPRSNLARVVEPVQQPGPEDLKVANNSDSRLPMPVGDASLLGIQRTLLESFQTRTAQREPEVVQVDADSPSLVLGLRHTSASLTHPNRSTLVPQFATLPSPLDTVSEEDVTAESPETVPTTFDRIPEVEDMDSRSIVLPSEISFEDSLLPPEYSSAWEGGSTT